MCVTCVYVVIACVSVCRMYVVCCVLCVINSNFVVQENATIVVQLTEEDAARITEM